MPGGILVSRRSTFALLTCACTIAAIASGGEVKVDIHVDEPTAAISPVLYGLFFEDINYAADGGLYAELVLNRSFEYYPVDGWAENSRRLHPLFAWSKVERDGGKVELAVESEAPLNKNNTKYLELKLSGNGSAGVRNEGFGGIRLEKGDKYDFSFHARRTEGHEAPLVVTLETKDGTVLGSATIDGVSDAWTKYEQTITAIGDATDAQLVLVTTGGGEVMLDVISLFPQDTFKGRKNGMRKDLAQALADLKPGFLRFPGGCIAHGQGLANAYRWKDTVGDVAQRKPNWNLWGYHQTYGLGYFEYMQLCEDIGAEPLPVVPLGVACGFRQPFDFAPMEDLHEWIDDALDLIEFANGPVDSEWGSVRAAMGHPEPFGLEYICLGNEEHDTPEVRERFPLFVDAIRKQYPDIKIIGTSGLGPEIPLYDLMTRTDVYSADEHYYMPPGWYLDNVHRFDQFDRTKPKIFVGEYASEDNRQFNAVAEAAYLTGIERNADIVDMACYAPLLAKYGSTQWTKADLIWFDNQQLVKTPNYYVQQLFSENKGDAYLKNTVEMPQRFLTDQSYAGRVGIGTWRTGIEVESASLDGKPLDFSNWEVEQGDFVLDDGTYAQRDRDMEAAVSVAPEAATGEKSVYRVRARKTGGREGFLLVFGHGDEGYYWWNVGGWGNTEHALQRRAGNQSNDRLVATRGSIESNRWYDLRVELEPGRIRCYIDDQLVHDYRPLAPEVVASPTFDKSTGELLLKIVNPGSETVVANVNLHGDLNLGDEVHVTTLAGAPDAMNTRESQPIAPVESTLRAQASMSIELPASSVQLLRVKVK